MEATDNEWVLYWRRRMGEVQACESFRELGAAWERFGELSHGVRVAFGGYIGLWHGDPWAAYDTDDDEPTPVNRPLARIGCDLCYQSHWCQCICPDAKGFEGRALWFRWAMPNAIDASSDVQRVSFCDPHWTAVEEILAPQIVWKSEPDQWLVRLRDARNAPTQDTTFPDELTFLRFRVGMERLPDAGLGGYFAVYPPLAPRMEGESDLKWVLRVRMPTGLRNDYPELCPLCLEPMDEPDRIRIGHIERQICQQHWRSVMGQIVAQY
jgi:hypothetical protein